MKSLASLDLPKANKGGWDKEIQITSSLSMWDLPSFGKK